MNNEQRTTTHNNEQQSTRHNTTQHRKPTHNHKQRGQINEHDLANDKQQTTNNYKDQTTHK